MFKYRKIDTFSNAKKLFKKTFLQKPNLALIMVCFEKKKPRAIWMSTKKKLCFNCWLCVNEPQSKLKIQYSWNNPFYLVIQVGSIGMNNVFGLPPTILTWYSKLTSLQEPFWAHRGDDNFNIFDVDSRSPPSLLICTIYIYVIFVRLNRVFILLCLLFWNLSGKTFVTESNFLFIVYN